MKRIILLLTLIGTTTFVRAQQISPSQPVTTNPAVGRWVLEVETDNLLPLKKEVGYGDSFFLRKIVPSIGYLATKKFLIGMAIPLGLAPRNGTYYSDGVTTLPGVYTTLITPKQIGIAPFAQQFFGTGKVKPFVGAAYRYSYQQLDLSIRELSVYLKQTGHESEVSVFTGLTYSITRRLGIDAKLRYGWQRGSHPFNTFPNLGESGYTAAFKYKSQTASANLGIRLALGQ